MAELVALTALLGEQEALRLEHNAAGKEFRERRLSEKDWRMFKDAWMQRSQELCGRIGAEKARAGIGTIGHSGAGCEFYAHTDKAEDPDKAVPILTVTKADMVAAYEVAAGVESP